MEKKKKKKSLLKIHCDSRYTGKIVRNVYHFQRNLEHFFLVVITSKLLSYTLLTCIWSLVTNAKLQRQVQPPLTNCALKGKRENQNLKSSFTEAKS